jgi:hypothetical protein
MSMANVTIAANVDQTFARWRQLSQQVCAKTSGACESFPFCLVTIRSKIDSMVWYLLKCKRRNGLVAA